MPVADRSRTVRRQAAGELLRTWRVRRRLPQLAVALTAGVSTRHLSFVETGRAGASAELLIALADVLDMPLRERNALLVAAGHAPRYAESGLDDPALAAARAAIARLLEAHEPSPGFALDGRRDVVLANAAARRLVALLPPALAGAGRPANLFRLGLHPDGFAAVTTNFANWGRHLLRELQRLVAASADPRLAALLEEVRGYPNVRALLAAPSPPAEGAQPLMLTCELAVGGRPMRLFTTLATFGSPLDVALAELTVELFWPADAGTEAALRAAAGPR